MVLSKLFSARTNLATVLIRRSLASGAKENPWDPHTHAANPDLWKKIFFFVCIPAMLISAVNTYLAEKEHHEHYKRREFKKMEYLYKRTHPFPWGDGNHTLFHNPRVNPLPEGWEDLPEEEGHH